MRWFYNFVFFIFGILSLPKTLKRQRKIPEYRGMLSRRFKCKKVNWKDNYPKIWLNAVSVGETIALGPLVKELEKEYPGIQLLISATTGTGYHRAKALYSEHQIIAYPFDFSFIVDKFLKTYQPDVFISCELDLWPNFLYGCQKFKVPFVVVSGRISDSSIGGYLKVKPLIETPLSAVSMFLAQDEIDAQRAEQIGLQKVKKVGNLKFDLLKTEVEELSDFHRNLKKEAEKFIVIASTHHPEEMMILEVLESIHFFEKENWKCILVPRHPERSEELSLQLSEKSIKSQFYVDLIESDEKFSEKVLIINQIGVLSKFYQLSDLCFIGGSLIPHGGQNMIEPAALGCAVFFGPHVQNFREASKILLDNQAAIQVENIEDLKEKLPSYLDDLELTIKLAKNAKQAIMSRRGVAKKTLQEIKTLL